MKKTSYCLELKAIGHDVNSVISTYHDMTGLGIKEAKYKVETAPCILLETTSMEDAQKYKTALETCGATVSISGNTIDGLPKLRKIGIDFIILNLIVIFGGAGLLSGIGYFWAEFDFFSMGLFFTILIAFGCFLANLDNNKYTDRMVAKTAKKSVGKQHFDKAYTFRTRNAMIAVDVVGGRIAYISNWNPWKFQVISAKDITDIKDDYKKGMFPETTHYVYFQFSYQGKVMRIPTFTSKHYRPLTMDKVKEGVRLGDSDFEKCLLQQTNSYSRGDAILVATSKENELFLINFYDNTFYIVKVAYENNRLNVVYDYRRKSFVLEEFQYRIRESSSTAMLKLMNSQVEFVVEPFVNYKDEKCTVVREQSGLYASFVSTLDTYRKNINESAMMRRNETGYAEVLQMIRSINADEKKKIWSMLDEGKKVEAIKVIQMNTGLGLADCKKIADNPYLYL